jgi:hypothetical protein
MLDEWGVFEVLTNARAKLRPDIIDHPDRGMFIGQFPLNSKGPISLFCFVMRPTVRIAYLSKLGLHSAFVFVGPSSYLATEAASLEINRWTPYAVDGKTRLPRWRQASERCG